MKLNYICIISLVIIIIITIIIITINNTNENFSIINTDYKTYYLNNRGLAQSSDKKLDKILC